MSDLLTEIDELMRQERMAKFWNDHGITIITVIVAIIIGTGVNALYKSWDKNVAQEGTTRLLTLIDSPEFPANINAADLDMRPGLRGIAYVTGAGAALDEGNDKLALDLYKSAIDDRKIPEDTRHLAILGYVRLLSAQGDTGVEIADELAPVLKRTNSPWHYHAHLEAALIHAHKAQDYARAQKHLNTIQDARDLPDTLYEKAAALNHVYALELAKQAAANPAATPAKTDEDS